MRVKEKPIKMGKEERRRSFPRIEKKDKKFRK